MRHFVIECLIGSSITPLLILPMTMSDRNTINHSNSSHAKISYIDHLKLTISCFNNLNALENSINVLAIVVEIPCESDGFSLSLS